MRLFRPSRLLTVATFFLAGAVIDRIAVVVGKYAITETEVLREVSLTEFLNKQPMDLGPAARRAAAERMVDQQLIAGEMKVSGFNMPAPAEADPLLAQVERGFHGQPQLRAALKKYGLTEADLRQHLLWQVAVLRFTQTRFPPAIPSEAENSANRAQEGGPSAAERHAAPGGPNESKGPAPQPCCAGGEDRQLEDWLKQTRASTRIEFKPEAFK
jgi:hypothetical protein